MRKALRHFRPLVSTVRARTTLAATVALAIALAISAVVVVYAERATLTNGIQASAKARADDVSSSLASADSNSVGSDVLTDPGNDTIIQITTTDRKILLQSSSAFRTQRLSTLAPELGHDQTEVRERLLGGPDEDFSILARRVETAQGDRFVYVATSLAPVTRATYALAKLFAVVVPLLVLIVGFTTWLATGKALSPVDEMRRRVDSIGSSDLDLRVSEPPTNDEIHRLARTMNAMLDRLETSSLQQRKFIADASHELRSPITAMRARLETAISYPKEGETSVSLGSDVLAQTLRMQQVVDDLLVLARLDGSTSPAMHRPVDLDEIVGAEVQALKLQTTHEVDVSKVSGAQLTGDQTQLTRVVRNVLDNAVRHAAARVEVTLTETEAFATLTIADDGPGIPAEDQELIFQRFARLDDARNRDSGGSGLGLAIVREIVAAHAGTVTVESPASVDGKGTRFIVELPTRSLPRESGPSSIE